MKIGIVGCGIGGLTFACLAHDQGHHVTLFDNFKAPAPVGSGLVLQPACHGVLKRLGLFQEVIEQGAKIWSMFGHEVKNNRAVLNVNYDVEGGKNFGLGIHRASLFRHLLRGAQNRNIEMRFDHHVTGSHRKDFGRFLNLSKGGTTEIFDLIVDASGVGSSLTTLNARELPYGAVWGTVDWPDTTELSQTKLQQAYLGAHKMIGILPLGKTPGDEVRKAAFFWSVPRRDMSSWGRAPFDKWQDQARALWPALDPFISQLSDHEDLTPALYRHGTMAKPYGDKIVFIGDAAHQASPQLGQGANMAMLDAAALVDALEQHGANNAGKAYWRARRRHVRVYHAISWAFTPMYQSDSRILPLIRDRILAPMSVIPPAPALLSRLAGGLLVKPIAGKTGKSPY